MPRGVFSRATRVARWASLLLVGLAVQLALGQTTEPPKDLLDEGQAPVGQPGAAHPIDATGQPLTDLHSVKGQPAEAPDIESVPSPSEAGYQPAPVARTESGLLDLHVRNLDIAALLEMLSYEARANIVTSTSVTGRVSANLYSVSLEEALAAILTPNKYAFSVAGSTVFVGTQPEIAALRPPAATRVFKLRYIPATEAAAAVKAVLSQDASVVQSSSSAAQGGGESTTGVKGAMGPAGVDYLIITDLSDRLTAAERLLAEVDQRPRQVLVESTVLRATLNETNQFGIDFTMLGGVDFQNVNSTSNASADLQTGLLPADDLQSTTFNINTRFAANVTGDGFTFGLIKDNIAAFIRALEEVTDVVVVANPKIVALNKQEAEVIVGRRDGYITTTVTETAAIQTVEFLETGTQIRFRPMINDDGTVRLAVHPKDSNGGLSAANLPFEETTEAQADILVNDGDTILIGGLFRERTVGSRSQIPLLGDIPWAGLLFGNRSDQTVREEVIILLTVHIVKETAQQRQQFAGLLEDVERMRVGSRMGLLGTGRERLAQAYYHEALRRLEAGDRGRALLNLRMTLHNQPKHLAALKLLERLLDERLWDEEGTRMRTFIYELIEHPGGLGTPPLGRPRIELEPGQGGTGS
jgi:type IV pilus assembly protein PilQ